MADPSLADRARILAVPPVPLLRRERFGPPLSVPVSSFVGREREADAVVGLLQQPAVRLVTLSGPGGVGKTRLAIRAAETAGQHDFADGATFVPLATVVDPAHVAPTVARTLGIREAGKRPLVERLADVLRDRHLLLVLDNFEQVVDAAPFLIGLLEACPRLSILATSRAPLNVSGEHVLTIQPLTLPAAGNRASVEAIGRSEAIRLFVARAQAARHDFALADDNAVDVAEIVRRLDGLPLAIELAAARITHLTPAALLARLEPRLPLLTGGARNLPERQRTMAATIAWSHELLTVDEQALFSCLAVFSGGFTLEAAETVAVGPDESPSLSPLDGIASLVNNSLLRQERGPDGEPRYAMLDTVREFGLERLVTSGEEREIRARHASWFVALAERADPAIWGGPEHGVWLDRLEADFANFRSALGWLDETGDGAGLLRLAAALGGLWEYRSHRAEGRAWLTRALASDDDTVPAARAMALVKLGLLEWSLDLTAESVALRRKLGDDRGVGRSLTLLGAIYGDRGEYDRAGAALEEAGALLEACGEINGMASVRWQLGIVAMARGDVRQAQTCLTEAFDLYRQDGFRFGIARTLLLLGGIDAERGDISRAADSYAKSLREWNQIGSQEGLINALEETAELAAAHNPAAATRLLGVAAAFGNYLGRVRFPGAQVRFERTVLATREALTEHAYEAAWSTGHSLTLEDATAEAFAVLAELEAMPPPSREGNATPRNGLTPRELDVLRQIAAGHSNRQIAESLSLSERTVENHVLHILTKLDVSSRTAAAGYAIRHGLA